MNYSRWLIGPAIVLGDTGATQPGSDSTGGLLGHSLSVVVEPPDTAVPPERARHSLRMCGGHTQQCAARPVRTTLPLFPVPQRLQTDPEHSGELALGRVKLVPNLHNVYLRELDVGSTSIRSVPREQRTLDVAERIFKRTRGTGIPRPTGRRVESFRFFIDESASFAVSMRFRRTIRHPFEQPLEEIIGFPAHVRRTSNGYATPTGRVQSPPPARAIVARNL